MVWVEERERLAGRRCAAGCGCAVIGLALVVCFGLAALVLTLGDCGPEAPGCHAGANNLLGWLEVALVATGLLCAAGLARWASRPPGGG